MLLNQKTYALTYGVLTSFLAKEPASLENFVPDEQKILKNIRSQFQTVEPHRILGLSQESDPDLEITYLALNVRLRFQRSSVGFLPRPRISQIIDQLIDAAYADLKFNLENNKTSI